MTDDRIEDGWQELLRPGENCWRIESAGRASVLVETDRYFEALRKACRSATRSILILGWDFDRRERIGRDENDPTLEAFFCSLLEEQPDLQVHILSWDYTFVYAAEREWFQEERLRYLTHDRLHVKFDGNHPTGGSQHQKVVVIDDAVAFCGGIDLSRWRWDSSAHAPDDERRTDPDGKAYPPFHDLMMLVEGPVAFALGDLVRERWRRCGIDIEKPGRRENAPAPWPEGVEALWSDREIGISRTMPCWREFEEIREIEQLYVDSIAHANDYIYIENQYLTSRVVTRALADRLAENDGPDVVLVLPRETGGWLEQVTMDAIRSSRIRHLLDSDRNGRLRVYYPGHSGLEDSECISVHSKLMLADDRFVFIGSANASNRSMGLDSECNLALIDEEGNGTGRLLHALLAEHLDCPVDEFRQARLTTGSLVQAIECLRRDSGRSLRHIDMQDEDSGVDLEGEKDIIDPEEPINAEMLIRRAVPPKHAQKGHRHMYLFLGFVLLLVIVGLSWRWTPLGEALTVERVTGWMAVFDHTWVRFLGASLGIVLLTMLMVPLTPLVVASALLLGPWLGFASAMAGALVSAALGFLFGLLMGGGLLERYSESRVHELSKRLSRRGILAVAVLRMVPVAPYSVVNIVAGASHLTLYRFLIGTAIGMAPGVAALCWFSESLWRAIKQPTAESFGLLVLAAAFIASAVVLLKRILRDS